MRLKNVTALFGILSSIRKGNLRVKEELVNSSDKTEVRQAQKRIRGRAQLFKVRSYFIG
jgi:hypothetical protein